MNVTITAYRAMNGQRVAVKTIRCSDQAAKEFVKMLFDLGFDDVSVV